MSLLRNESIGQWLRRYWRTAPQTAIIIVLCVGAWLVSAVQSGSIFNSYYGSDFAYAWTLWGPLVAAGGYSRVVAAAFMHLDLGHLVVNCIMLAFIGREVEVFLGKALYAAVYLVTVLGASAAVLWQNFDVPTVGASGAVFALMVLLVGVHRRKGLDLRAPLVLVAANVGYTFITPQVSMWGHLGGLITGLVLLGLVFHPNLYVRWAGVAAVGVAAMAAIVFLAGAPIPALV